MQRLRALGFEVFLWLSVVIYSTLLLFLAPIFSTARLHLLVLSWERSLLWALCRFCRLSYRVTGQEHLQPGCGQIIFSNHQSAWETIALGPLLPTPHTWVMKRELLRIPFFGWALRLFQPIAIDRSSGRQALKQLLSVGAKRLAEGHLIVIFPEGTRVAPGKLKRFGVGGAMLAAHTGMPVVPIAHNAGYFWGRKPLQKRPGIIDVVIGPPIPTQGLSADRINALAEDWIRAKALLLAKEATNQHQGHGTSPARTVSRP
ncbi:MAG: lysophospholipid acyltransferase family protein [Lamprobacter sp.]|uniref:lysophospholipid acyltransferase family protein n=1 Tax=Lamprobacter sp. TaxID=3100796 RepID=UPI002B263268|nr:lysophospholipid acyltransferase family protein [Lamprobacter sp.]MEA3638378.1 lysophospholipid acyltransferase family protein [Lamprobacter sp.]